MSRPILNPIGYKKKKTKNYPSQTFEKYVPLFLTRKSTSGLFWFCLSMQNTECGLGVMVWKMQPIGDTITGACQLIPVINFTLQKTEHPWRKVEEDGVEYKHMHTHAQ